MQNSAIALYHVIPIKIAKTKLFIKQNRYVNYSLKQC